MTDNQRFFKAFEFLKEKGFMKTYLHLAETLNTDEVEIKELKKEKKQVPIEHIRTMVKIFPKISLRWLILEEGELYNEDKSNFDCSVELLIMQKEKINELKKEIAHLKSDTGSKKNMKSQKNLSCYRRF